MSQPDISLFASLRAAYDASRAVRSPEDLVGVLENVAGIVSENLGWRGVAIHVHRRAWDDFEATVVHCGDETCDLRLGARREWREWAPLFRDEFERHGAHFIPGTAGDSADPGAWRAGDMLRVLMRGSDGEVAGILSVDEPADGRRPTDEQVDALVAVASSAGAAVEQAREAASDHAHQSALQELLAVSTRIADARSDADVLDAVCAGISEALHFECVAVELADTDGELVYAAGTGWETAPRVPVTLEQFQGILRPEFEQHGCYLLDHTSALQILGLADTGYCSKRNGRGPWAWHRHWL